MPKLILYMLSLLLTAGLAAPSVAGTLYKWTGADGSVSFADDLERVPERHRAGAEKIEASGLGRYARYTPTDGAAQRSHRERLDARLEKLREARALEHAVAARASVAAPALPTETVVQINDDTAIRVPIIASDDGPVIVEEVRVRRPGSNFTIHDTVVRRGDQILMVVRPPQPHQAGPGDFVDEAELLQ